MQMQSSVIKIVRKKNWKDLSRAYEIILDGENVGIILASQSISVPVEPGHHSLKMKIDWGGSEEINFSIDSGEEITFICEFGFSILRLLLIPYYLIFKPKNWILLKQC
jgi:hypothetical protein